MSNHEFSGVSGWFDLEDQDCQLRYKNEYEVEAGFQCTKSNILALYLTQLQQLKTSNEFTERSMHIEYMETQGSLKQDTVTIMERFKFFDGADSINHFLKAIMAQYKRRQWDRSVNDLRLVLPVIDKNMLIMEELSNELVSGYNERELVLKRFVFRANGCIFVYTSSVPDEVHCDEESGRDDAERFTLVFSIMCFKRDGKDLIMERIKQVDFRLSHRQMINQYLTGLSLKAQYWQQDLTEKVAYEELRA